MVEEKEGIMKRSEAVVKLQKILKKYEDCEMDLKAASAILKSIEKMGMEPPFREWETVATGMWVVDSEDCDDAVFKHAENSWEPES